MDVGSDGLRRKLSELLLDKLAMEQQALAYIPDFEHPASHFPTEIDYLCVRNLPGHFVGVNMGSIPSAAAIIESLKDTVVEIAVTPRGNADSPEGNLFAKPHLIRQPVSWLMECIAEGRSDRHYYFQSQDDNLRELDCPIPKTLSLPCKYLGAQQAANLWLGTGGTTSRLHCDNYDNIYVQVAGTKRIYLLPPSSVLDVEERMLRPATYNAAMDLVPDSVLSGSSRSGDRGEFQDDHSSEGDAADDVASTLQTVLFPTYDPATQAKRGCQWVVDLQPGDILFLPALWYHQVEIRGSGANLSINYWHTPFDDERRWAAWNFARQISREL